MGKPFPGFCFPANLFGGRLVFLWIKNIDRSVKKAAVIMPAVEESTAGIFSLIAKNVYKRNV